MDLGYAMNYTNLYLVDTTPDAETRNWARLGQGILSAEPDNEDETAEDYYYDGEGASETDVTGVKLGYKFSGNRRYGNVAQDYICGLLAWTGGARKTRLRHIAPNGRIIEGAITVTDIVDGGGDANSKGAFEFVGRFSGLPSVDPPNSTVMPTAITTVAPISVAKEKTIAVVPTTTPIGAPNACAYAVEDVSIATVGDDGTVTGVAVGKTKLSIKSMVLPSVRTVVEITVPAAAN